MTDAGKARKSVEKKIKVGIETPHLLYGLKTAEVPIAIKAEPVVLDFMCLQLLRGVESLAAVVVSTVGFELLRR